MRDSFVSAVKLFSNNPDLVFLTADLGCGCFDEIESLLSWRYINVGVCEQNMINVACGLCLSSPNIKVIVYSIANFPTIRCLDQIRNGIAYHNLPVLIVSNGVGFSYGQLGATHHATEDLAIMRSIPNIDVASPASSSDVTSVTSDWLSCTDAKPTYLRLDKSKFHYSQLCSYQRSYSNKFISYYRLNAQSCTAKLCIFLGATSSLISSELNSDVLILTMIPSTGLTLKIEQIMKDYSTLHTFEEQNIYGGLFSYISMYVAKFGLNCVVKPHGIDGELISYVGDQAFLRSCVGLLLK